MAEHVLHPSYHLPLWRAVHSLLSVFLGGPAVVVEDSPANAFVAALKYWRDVRTYTQSALARAVGSGPSYVSKVESGQQHPSTAFAESADRVLNTGARSPGTRSR